jgi:diguanylate cyclase (GGDEF)-like protein
MDKADTHLDPDTLMAIIRVQSEIAKLGVDLGRILDLVTQRVQQLTRAASAIVELADGEEMVYRAASGISGDQLGLRLQRQGSLSGLAVTAGDILQCADTERDPRVDIAACRRIGIRSMVVAPLAHDAAPIGVLKIASTEVAAFDARDVAVLALMTEAIGAAIHHATDISELYDRATRDPLTGVSNRALFYDRLRQDLMQAQRRDARVGIIALDLDGLKPINDQFGHRAGDAAIQETASRIRRVCRRTDTVARLGGDEFGVVLAEVKDRASAEQQARRISQEIGSPFEFDALTLPLAASIGVALFPDDGQDLHQLIHKADQAMYALKRARRGDAARAPSSHGH